MNVPRRPKLPPRPIHFEGLTARHHTPKNLRWVKVIGFRPPRKGEYYLSGAIVEAYKAPNDLTSSFWIVEALSIDPEPVVLHQYA